MMHNAYRLLGPMLFILIASCAHVGDSVKPLSRVSSRESIQLLEGLPEFETGPTPYDCGPESAAYTLKYFGQDAELHELSRELVRPEKKGTAIEVLLAYFKRERPGENLDARLINANRTVLRQVIDQQLMPIVMVDVGRFPADTFRAAETLYAGQFHFYPVVGYGPDGIVVAEQNGLTHITWDLFERMWFKAGGRCLVVWDRTGEHALQGNPSLRRRYNQAVKLISQSTYSRALKKLKNITDQNPLFARAYGSIGYVRFKQKQFEKAELNYRKALSRNPGLMQVQNNLAHVLVKQGKQLEEAEKRVNAVIRDGSGKWRNHWEQENKRKTTPSELEAASVRIRALLAKAYHTRGMLHEKRKEWDNARADYLEALRFTTADSNALKHKIFSGLGRVQARLNRWVEARNAYIEALKLARNKRQREEIREKMDALQRSLETKEENGIVPPTR